jgi:hypothetical protein
MNLVDPNGQFVFAPVLAAAVAVAIVVDIVANTSVKLGSNAISVSIPPPSMFKRGVPLPFALGFKAQATGVPVAVPGTDFQIGVPKSLSCEVTTDPRFVPTFNRPVSGTNF